MLGIVERPKKNTFGDINTHTHPHIAPREKSLSYKSAYCLGIVFVIGNYALILNLTPSPEQGKFFMGKEVFRGKFFGENLTPGEFGRISIGNGSYVLLSHCLLNFKHVDVKGNCPGKKK